MQSPRANRSVTASPSPLLALTPLSKQGVVDIWEEPEAPLVSPPQLPIPDGPAEASGPFPKW